MPEADEPSRSVTGKEGVAIDASAETRNFFEAVLGSLGEAVFVVNPPDRRILMTNQAVGELFGVDPAELIGQTTRLIYRNEEDHRLLAGRTEEALARGRPYRGEFRFRRADGTVFQAHVTTTAIDPDDWTRGVVSVLRDVSALRDAQERAGHLLAALESRVRKLRCVRQAATLLTDQAQPLEVAFQRVVESIPPALGSVDATWASIEYGDVRVSTGRPDPRGHVIEVGFAGLEGRTGTLKAGYRMEDPDDRLAEAETLVESLGFLLQSHCRGREHRRRTEQERDRFFQLFRASPVASSLSDPRSGVFFDVNEKWELVTGYDRDELIGRSSVEIDLWENPAARARLGERLERERSVDDFRVRFRRKDGAIREAYGSLRVIELEGRPFVFATLHDITDQLLIEERQARMVEQQVALERLGAIGELAGGVAHDINNLLLPILVNVELALPDASADLRPLLEEVKEAAKRGRDLTRKLLSFSGKQTLRKRPLDLAEVVASSRPTLRRLVPEIVTLDFRTTDDLPEIDADPAQLELVLVNLVGNARDAMDASGHIEVSTSVGPARGSDSVYGVSPPEGDYVYLHVSDDGSGIPPDIRSRIFEPFFSTKEDSTGAGLGLSSVLGIVEQHGGHIVVDTDVGEGATFHLGFPVLRGDAGADVEDGDHGELDRNAGEGRGVLVVEDDPAVRRVTSRALRSFGFRVVEAEDGSKALAALESREADVDVIISDMVMPGMTGLDLRQAVRESWPDLPVLFVSGYSWSTLTEQGVDRDSVSILEKPFTPQQLVRAVHATLSESEKQR